MSNRSQSKTVQKPKLTEEFFYSILGEYYAFRKRKTKYQLAKVMTLYRDVVEVYSYKNDPIYVYFREKISQLSMYIPTLQESEYKLTTSMAIEVLYSQYVSSDSRFKSVITTPVKYDPYVKRKYRSKNAQIAIELHKIKKRANARTILKSYYDECMENNVLVNADLQEQRKQLYYKLIAIRKNKIILDKKSMEFGNKKVIV